MVASSHPACGSRLLLPARHHPNDLKPMVPRTHARAMLLVRIVHVADTPRKCRSTGESQVYGNSCHPLPAAASQWLPLPILSVAAAYC
jgi:hypothetical protein